MKKLFSIILILVVSLPAIGAITTTVSSIKGTEISTSLSGSALVVRDQYYSNLVAGGGTVSDFKIARSSISTVLKYDQSSFPRYDEFNLIVDYDIELRDSTGALTTVSGEQLEIKYEKDGASTSGVYVDYDMNRYENYLYGRVTEINSITFQDLQGSPADILTDIPDDVYFNLECETYRYYDLNTSTQISAYQNTSEVTSKNHLRISWDYIKGAESYDLEWVFVDIPSGTISTDNTAYDWKNATRINTTDNHYFISLGYPRGAIIYRVRPVGVDVDNRAFTIRVEGAWSYTPGTLEVDDAFTASQAYAFSGLNTDMNWTYDVSFAEDGKRKELIQYFDGSSRSRQSVTILNTDTNAIIGETMYDHQGRPALEVLPTPASSAGIGFYDDGSGFSFNKQYDREDFDTDQRLVSSYTAGSGYTGPLGMDSMSVLSSKYYSEENGTSGQGKAFIPDAENYPFVQTLYKNDGTDRVVEKSAPGKTFKIGDDRTTQYMYGRPTQEELDRLFGNEIGFAKHYKKNAIVDPNGQAVIQYLDQEDRIVATAMAGDSPDNLEDLKYRNDSVQFTSNLLKNNNELINGLVESSYVISIYSGTQEIDFSYSLTGAESCDSCRTAQRCDSCEYDLIITLKDECGAYVDDTSGTTINPTNYTWENIRTASGGTFDFTASLSPGTYVISKTLVLDNTYRDSLAQAFKSFLSNLDSLALQNCVAWSREELDCEFGCDSMCYRSYRGTDASGTRIWYDDDGAQYADSSGHPPYQAQNAIDSCLNYCNSQDSAAIQTEDLNECDMKYEMMRQHMSPGGQYFDNTVDKYLRNADGSFQVDDSLYQPVPNSSYDTTAWLEANVGSTPPSYMYDTWDSVRTYFEDAWADSLVVNYHPEYCIYQYYCLDTLEFWDADNIKNGDISSEDRRRYDRLSFESTSDSWAASNRYGYNFLNPFNLSTSSATCSSKDNKAYINESSGSSEDPFYTAAKAGIPVKLGKSGTSAPVGTTVDLKKDLQEYFEHETGQYFSLWFMLDDPCSIAVANGSSTYTGSTLDQAEIDIFNTFHGAHVHDDGLIGNDNDQVTKYSFFRSSYQFYKQFLLYSHFDDYDTLYCPDQYNYWDGDTDYDGMVDTTYFQLLWPRNQVFDNFTQPMDSSVFNPYVRGQKDTSCFNTCEAFADSWIDQVKDSCLTAYNALTSAQQDSLKEKLIDICILGCDSTDWGSSNGNGVDSILTHGPRSITYAHNFDEVIQDYIDPASCTVTITHKDTLFNLGECTCDSLWAYIDTLSNIPALNHDYPRATAMDSIATELNSDFGYSFSGTDIDRWLSFCENGSGHMTDIPIELECTDCKCGNLEDFITGNFPWMDPTSLTSAQEDSIADELEDILGGTIVGDSVNVWLDQCDNADPDGLRFLDFPEFLRCTAEYEGSVDIATYINGECENDMDTLEYQNAWNSFIELVEEKVAEYKEDYNYNCYNNIDTREQLTMDYTLNEYYYTLYYYDQAGNLIKTVPPRGVNPITRSTALDSINDYRLDSTSQTVFFHPDHSYITNYKYDTYNNIREQSTPDGNGTQFWYDNVGRMIVSQNARQVDWSAGGTWYYSYTLYDDLGRITEVGEAVSDNEFFNRTAKDATLLSNWRNDVDLVKRQVTRTYYDTTINSTVNGYFADGQEVIRARVSSVTYEESDDDDHDTYDYATHYSYDIHGNVKELIQENKYLAITAPGQQLKHVKYEYDIVSGNVNKVTYQEDEADQFMHRYCYDADNRITQVETSKDDIIWENDARYHYYQHGPLHRTEVGDHHVQACDYAYTAQGWLKAQNANTLKSSRDMGKDGLVQCSNQHRMFAEDAMGFSLGYYDGDYSPIDTTIRKLANQSDYFLANLYDNATGNTPSAYLSNTNELYNGNISMMVTAMLDDDEDRMAVHGSSYSYDQANRLMKSKVYQHNDSAATLSDSITHYNSFEYATNNGSYATYYSYDLNGNIDSLSRWGQYNYNLSTPIHLDSLSYRYANTDETFANDHNYLMHIDDQQGLWSAGVDLDDQGTFTVSMTNNNYEYDSIGQLIKDTKEDIDTIIWNVYGKVSEIRYSVDSKDNLEFLYDPAQNRIGKIVKPKASGTVKDEEFWTKYFYVRDAQGNILTVYKETFAEDETTSGLYHSTLDVLEYTIYGSKRLGVDNDGVTATTSFNANYVSGEFVAANGRVMVTNAANQSYQFWASNDMKLDVNDGSGTFDLKPLALCSLNTDGALTVNDGKYEFVSGGGGTDYYIVQPGDVVNITVNDTVYFTTNDAVGLDANETITFGSQDVPVELVSRWSIERKKNIERTVGEKQYELANHLGNVLNTITDRKNAVDGDTVSVDEFTSTVENWTGVNGSVAVVSNALKSTASGSGGGMEKGFDVTEGKLYRTTFDLTGNTSGERVIVEIYQQDPYSATPLMTDTVTTSQEYSHLFCASTDSITWKITSEGGVNGDAITIDDALLDEDGYYTADVLNATDYYPFGMPLPGRSFSGAVGHRYGYQGSEKDDEVSGTGNSFTTFFRQGDPRVVRWWSVDPKANSQPWQSPFSYMDGSPIMLNDVLGDDTGYTLNKKGKIKKVDDTGGDKYDVLFTEEKYKKGDKRYDYKGTAGTGIRIDDKSFLPSLMKDKKSGMQRDYHANGKRTYHGDGTYTDTYPMLQGHYSKINANQARSVFFFLADNSNVEWALLGQKGHQWTIGTVHEESQAFNWGSLNKNLGGGYEQSTRLFDYHSQPGVSDDAFVPSGNDYGAARGTRKHSPNAKFYMYAPALTPETYKQVFPNTKKKKFNKLIQF